MPLRIDLNDPVSRVTPARPVEAPKPAPRVDPTPVAPPEPRARETARDEASWGPTARLQAQRPREAPERPSPLPDADLTSIAATMRRLSARMSPDRASEPPPRRPALDPTAPRS